MVDDPQKLAEQIKKLQEKKRRAEQKIQQRKQQKIVTAAKKSRLTNLDLSAEELKSEFSKIVAKHETNEPEKTEGNYEEEA